MSQPRCPHCGNTNPKLIQDNGLAPTHHDYTLLCVALVEAGDHAYAGEPLDVDEDGLTQCGEQWEPNS